MMRQFKTFCVILISIITFQGYSQVDFSFEDTTALPSTPLEIPLVVSNFYNLLGIQFSINYDPAVIEFVSITNFNLPGLSAANFGNPSPGVLVLSWLDPSFSGVSVPDNTQIFSIVFNAIGISGTNSILEITNTPTTIEVIDGDSNAVQLFSTPANISIQSSLSIVDENADIDRIYPNPSTNYLNIISNSPIETIEFYDINGRFVFKTKITSQLNIKQLSKGLYFLKITLQNNKIIHKKMIKN
jgi:hypothetical protein